MNLAEGVILVERRSKAEAYAALLGGRWNVVCLSGSVPESAFEHDVARVELADNERLVLPPELLAARTRLSGSPNILAATDPTLLGEAAAAMMARVLEIPDLRRIDLREVSEEGLQRAISQSRRIDEPRVAIYEKERLRNTRLAVLYRKRIQSVMGREDFFPKHFERVLLGAIVDRERMMRLSPQPHGETAVLQIDHWKATLEGPAPSIAALESARHRVTVAACTTTAEPDPTPPALNFPDLVLAARARFGFSSNEVVETAYQLYLRGMITWPFTTSMRLDSRGLRAAWDYAQRMHLPVRDSRAIAHGRPAKSSRGHAIRPVDITQETISASQDLRDLYALIHERTLLCILEASIAKQRTITLELKTAGAAYQFVARSWNAIERGWRIAATAGSVPGPWDEFPALPILNPGDRIDADLKREPFKSREGVARFSEEFIGAAFAHAPQADCSDWYRALKNLRLQGFVRVRAGEISPTPFGVSVMHAIRSMRTELAKSVPQASISHASLPQATVSQATVSQATVSQASVSQASFLQAPSLQASALQAPVLQAPALETPVAQTA